MKPKRLIALALTLGLVGGGMLLGIVALWTPTTRAQDVPSVPSAVSPHQASFPIPPCPEGTVQNGWTIEYVDCPKSSFSYETDRSLTLDADGHPHIAYGGDFLYYAYYDGSDWHYETADFSAQVGAYAAITLDANGNPHISYYDEANGDLKYAYRDAAGWHSETVDSEGIVGWYTSIGLDGSGHPHIAYYFYYPGKELKYAYRDAGGWHIETVDTVGPVGEHVSLVLDENGHPHISYFDDGNRELKHAYRDADGWHIEIVDDQVNVGDTSITLDGDGYLHIGYGDMWGNEVKHAYQDVSGWHIEVVDTTAGNPDAVSIAIDGSNLVHISYEGKIGGTLSYAYRDAVGQWFTTEIGSGSNPSLATDADGEPHVSYVYYFYGHTTLKYAYHDTNGWHIRDIDDTSWAGYSASLAVDGDGNPHIGYYGDVVARTELKYAYRGASGWYTQTVREYDSSSDDPTSSLALDGEGDPHIAYTAVGDTWYLYQDASIWHSETVFDEDGDLSLALDGDGYPRISYSPGRDLWYAYRDASDWYLEAVDVGSNDAGTYNSLVLDADGYPHISYHDWTDYDLKYAYQDTDGWHIETVDSAGSVGEYSSLALDANGNPHISYYDASHAHLKYAYRDASGWHTETVDPQFWVGKYTSLALDANGYPHISYFDSENNDLKYAYQNATGWHIETVDSLGDVGVHTSIVVDGDGRIHIAYRAYGVEDLKYATKLPMPSPALQVSKAATPDPAAPGGTLTYTLRLTNTGDVSLTVTVTDTLPAYVTPSGMLTWAIPAFAPGAVWTQTVVVTVDAGYSGVLTNIVQAVAPEGAADVYTATTHVFSCTAPTAVSLAGPDLVVADTAADFTATLLPSSASPPFTYTWRATGQAPFTHTGGLSDTASFTWAITGAQMVTVTVENACGTVWDAHLVWVSAAVVVTITPDGGQLTYTDPQGLTTTLTFPAGAITQTATLTYTPVTSPTHPLPSSQRFAGHAFTLEAAHGGSPLSGLSFARPVTITLYYADEDVASVDEMQLTLEYWDTAAGQWQDVTTTCTPPTAYQRYPDENRLLTAFCHLSEFALLGQSAQRLYLPLILRRW